MINKEIDKMILEATKSGKKDYLKVLKLVKAEFQKAKCKPGRNSKEDLTEIEEAQVLLKMVDERKKSIEEYTKANRKDLADVEQGELNYIAEFLPAPVTENEIEECTAGAITAYKLTKEEGYELSMKDMKPLMAIVKEKYPAAEGKIISKVLMSVLKK